MSGTSPPSSPATSPATCRWKKGRPVFPYYGNGRSSHSKSAPQGAGAMPLHTDSGPRTLKNSRHGSEIATSNPLREPKLWTSSQGIRFAQTVQLQSTLITAAHKQASGPDSDGVQDVNLVRNVGPECAGRDAEAELMQQGATESFVDDSTAELQGFQEDHLSIAPHDSDYMPSDNEDLVEKSEDGKDAEDADAEEEVEEHLDLEYQIPEEVLRAAMAASPDTRGSFWQTKLYKGPKDEDILLHYCKTFEIAERVAKYFRDEKVLGFDIEWKPQSLSRSIKQNASLIQLASENRIALFHIALFEGNTVDQLLPPSLRTVLESPEIVKVGVAVKGDFSRLQKYLGIQPQGVFELSRLHNLVEWHAKNPSKVTKKLVSLATQVLRHLQLPLYKGGQLQDDPEDTSNVRESDWSKSLNNSQIYYAAADAYAGFRLYHMLEWKRKQLRPTPTRPDLCDYDALPRPKSKSSTKKTKSVSKKQDGGRADAGAQTATKVDSHQADVAEEDDAEAYETAAEDVMDSHELEDPASQAGTEQSSKTRRVGHVSTSFLQGLDPAYSQLPAGSQDSDTVLDPDQLVGIQNDAQTFVMQGIKKPEFDNHTEDHEFADPELELAFSVLNLDEEGRMIESKDTNATKSTEHLDPSIKQQAARITDTARHDSDVETPAATSLPSFSPLVPEPTSPHSPEYDHATTWAQTYLKSTIPSVSTSTPSRIRATVPHLRAYYMWREQNLSLDEIASHLRDPPLSTSTVTGYILQAVTLEKLEYDEEGMRAVVEAMPAALRKGRWKWMAEKLGVS